MKTVTEYIYIENSAIDGDDFDKTVCNKLMTKKGTCNQHNGYIIDVSDKFEILSIQISNAGDGMYAKVKYSYEGIKPKAGDKLTGIVSQITKYGITVNYSKLLNTTISVSSLKGYKFNEVEKTFQKDNIIIKIGDKINYTITIARFVNSNFACVGILD